MPLNTTDQQRDDIHYEQYPPDHRISTYVDRILYGYAPSDIEHQISIPPVGGVFISYVIGSPITVKFQDRTYDNKPKIFIGGQLKTEAPILIPESDFGLIGFQLKPTGFFKLFGTPSDRLTDDIMDLYEVDAAGCSAILNQIQPDDNKDEIINILANYIIQKEKPEVDCGIIDDIIYDFIANQGNIRIKDVIRTREISSSKLRREFLKKVGLSPKYFAKIVQFNNILELLVEQKEDKLNQIALNCGYFDQAHFIHDFQKYLGMNPMAFVRSNDSFLRTFLSRMRD